MPPFSSFAPSSDWVPTSILDYMGSSGSEKNNNNNNSNCNFLWNRFAFCCTVPSRIDNKITTLGSYSPPLRYACNYANLRNAMGANSTFINLGYLSVFGNTTEHFREQTKYDRNSNIRQI